MQRDLCGYAGRSTSGVAMAGERFVGSSLPEAAASGGMTSVAASDAEIASGAIRLNRLAPSIFIVLSPLLIWLCICTFGFRVDCYDIYSEPNGMY